MVDADLDLDPRCPFEFPDGERCIDFIDHDENDWSAAHTPPGGTLPPNPGYDGPQGGESS